MKSIVTTLSAKEGQHSPQAYYHFTALQTALVTVAESLIFHSEIQ